MGVMVCQKCGLPDSSPKPLRCTKCGAKDFYESAQSAFAPKKIDASVSTAAAIDQEKTSAPAETVTLFDKYGGVPTIAKLVRSFHKEIMLRPHLAAYFDGIDLGMV